MGKSKDKVASVVHSEAKGKTTVCNFFIEMNYYYL